MEKVIYFILNNQVSLGKYNIETKEWEVVSPLAK